jgi:hypothetical protein
LLTPLSIVAIIVGSSQVLNAFKESTLISL